MSASGGVERRNKMELIQPRDGIMLWSKNRSEALSRIVPHFYISDTLGNKTKFCAWCGKIEIPKKKKYCSESCQNSAVIYCWPHHYISKQYHIEKQNFKCDCCGFDYSNLIEKSKWRNKFSMRMFLRKCREIGKPLELHHKNPISKGGNGIGIGMAMLCRDCHKREGKI